jgi:hypothetical protein
MHLLQMQHLTGEATMAQCNQYVPPDNHEYNNPGHDSLSFMRAVMNDHTLPVPIRLEAANKLAPFEHPRPTPIPAPAKPLVRAPNPGLN